MSDQQTTAEILAAFDNLARIWGPPAPPEPADARLRRLAEEDAAERLVDAREAARHYEGLALDARDDRIVRGYVEGSAA